MLYRKGGAAVGEYVGIVVFILAITILGLTFLGCSVLRSSQDFEVFQISKAEIDITRDISLFLKIPVVEDKLMSDAIIDRVNEYYALGTRTFDDQEIFKNDIMELTKGHIQSDQRLMIIFAGGGIIYDSFGNYVYRDISYDEPIEGVAKLPVATGSGDYEFIEVVLQPLTR